MLRADDLACESCVMCPEGKAVGLSGTLRDLVIELSPGTLLESAAASGTSSTSTSPLQLALRNSVFAIE